MEDTDKEIENILNENPLESKANSKSPLKTKNPNQKRKFPKKKIIIGIGIIFLIISMGFIFFSGSCECEVCNVCEECVQTISMENIKQQIIEKGYADISDGESNLKLAPYIQ